MPASAQREDRVFVAAARSQAPAIAPRAANRHDEPTEPRAQPLRCGEEDARPSIA